MVNHDHSADEDAKVLSDQRKYSAEIVTDGRDATAHHPAWRYDQQPPQIFRAREVCPWRRSSKVHGELGAAVRNLLTWAVDHERDEPVEDNKSA
jgi:hypothetical protein